MNELSVDGYFADENGNIFSTKNRKNKTGLPYLMKCYTDNDGYKQIVLRINGKKKRFPVHRLVCEAFNGKSSTDKNICMHLNGAPSDNRPENLKWGTQKENKSHEKIHGTRRKGESMHNAIYTDSQIARVKAYLVEGLSYMDIAKITGVEYQSVCNCASGKQWAHIPFPGEFEYVKKSGYKLTESDVVNIKEMLDNGLKPVEIADIFGVHRITVHDIKVGRTWLSIN